MKKHSSSLYIKLLLFYFENNFQNENMSMVCPLRIDMYCNNNTETALHAAVKGKHYDIALTLLNAGASANAIIKPYVDYNEVNLTCLT